MQVDFVIWCSPQLPRLLQCECVMQRVQIPDEEDHPARQAGSLIGRRQEFKVVFKREVKAWTLLGEYCGVSEAGCHLLLAVQLLLQDCGC